MQPTRCTRERGPEVFPQLSSKYHKTETRPTPVCNESGSTLLDTNCPSSKIHMKMNFFDKNGYFAVNFTCIATITYFRRFLTLVFVYVSSSAKSMYHICITAVVIRVNKEKNPAIFPYLSVRRKYILNYLIY